MNKNFLLIINISSILIIPLTISYIFISYTKSLENKKCNCSEDVRRKYVKYYGYFLLILSILGLFVAIFSITNPKLFIMNEVIKYISLFVSIVSAYVLYSYSDILESNDCKCSESWKRIFIKYYAYFILGLYSILFFCLTIIFIIHIIAQDDNTILSIKKILKSC